MKLLVVCLVVFTLGAPATWAQQSDKSSDRSSRGRDTDTCDHMMKMHQKMQEHMQAMDDELKGLVEKMNSASGQEKVDAMAAVINKELEQRKEMRDMMSKAHRREMHHAMTHMKNGDMAKCPMMNDADEAAGAEKSSDDQHEHHQK